MLAIKTDLFVCRVLTGCAGSVRAHLSAILAFHPIPISIEEGARNSCERETQHFPNKGTSKRTVYETEGGVHVLFTIVSPIKTKDNRVLHSLENRKEKSIEVYFAPAVVNVKGDSCSRVPREVAWCRATDKNNNDWRCKMAEGRGGSELRLHVQAAHHRKQFPSCSVTRTTRSTSAFVSTVGIDFKVKTVFRHDKRVKLQIWDTAGQERYRTITTAYYRGAMGFILMYDITNEESFNSVQDWVTQIKTYSWDNAQVILVGNKCDMEEERVVSTERGMQLAEQLGVEFYETSAKENIYVKAVFERLVDIICDKMSESLDSEPAMLAGGARGQRLTEQPQGNSTTNCNC
ncbi:hypothetical protein SFRURICE_001101 [Spodoptera frugiperda]|nr:hypothetical protein SFRURICE_001101 [Spodoptera frugiperda]